MKTKLILSLILSFSFYLLSSQAPQGFNYQAIARNGSGDVIASQLLPVRITIQTLLTGGTIIWEETHSVTTNQFGIMTFVIGTGTRTGGSATLFSDINWSAQTLYLKTEVDAGTGFTTMGTTQLWSVPYSMVANNLGGPVDKLGVKGTTTDMEEALFEVKNKNGQTVFAVYNEGVRIYVDDGDAKGAKGGFAIGGFDAVKSPGQQYFVVSADSIRGYIYDDPLVKTPKGGFAIGGFDNAKGLTNDYLLISPDSSRVYVNNAPSTKGAKGGFAIGGFDLSKGTTFKNLMSVSDDSIRLYIRKTPVKGAKGGFAIGGFDEAKGSDEEYLRVTRDSTRIYVMDAAKGAKGGFAIGGFDMTKGGAVTPFTSLTPDNYFIGHRSGVKNKNGLYNSFVGYETGSNNVDGNNNVFLGFNAGFTNNANNNVFLGYQSGLTNSSGSDNVFLGTSSGYSNLNGYSNTFLGHVAGYTNGGGANNVFLGDSAGYSNLDGDQNIFLGNGSGKANSSGDYNAFIGYQAGRHNIGGLNNAFIGYQAGYTNNAGNNNAFIGYQAGRSTYRGSKNVFIGYQAGFLNYGDFEGPTQYGNNNIYIGDQSGYYNMTGRSNVYIGHNAGNGANPINIGSPPIFNVYIGYQAGYLEYSGTHNTFIGYQTGYTNRTGSYSTFIGYKAGNAQSTGSYNTFIGYRAGISHTDNGFNLFVGTDAGFSNLTGVNNVFLGYRAGYYETLSNKLFIDNQDRTDEATSRTNSLIYGEFNATVASQVLRINGKVGIMLAANPTQALEVNGNVKATTFIATSGVAGAYMYNTNSPLNLPDYVFDKHFDGKSTVNPVYEMMNLSDLNRFISANRHLPRVPSRKEIDKDGVVNIQGLSMITLEKVEENTLYILELEKNRIDQQKTIEEQQNEIDILKAQNEEKEKRIKSLEMSVEQINKLKEQIDLIQTKIR